MAESNNKNLERKELWLQLNAHREKIADLQMSDLFRSEPDRANKLSVRIDDLVIDSPNTG